jgi:hypothetical protein
MALIDSFLFQGKMLDGIHVEESEEVRRSRGW